MERTQKVEAVDALKGVFADAGVVVVTHYAGLTVAEMTDLRAKLREKEAQFKVIKNRLAKIALQDTPGEAGGEMFTGPVGIAFSKDPVAASKVAVEYAKGNEKFALVGGILGAQVLDAEGVKALADMPSIDELRAKLLGVLQAPMSQFAGLLNKPAEQLARTVGEPSRGLASVLAQRGAQEAA